jgi:acyl transferase domain-containing protein
MLESLAALYTMGVPVDWLSFDRDYPRSRVALPTYPFQRQRFWIDDLSGAMTAASTPVPDVPPLSWHPRRLPSSLEGRMYESRLSLKAFAFLADHRVEGLAILPAAGYLTLLLGTLDRPGALDLTDVVFVASLALPADGALHVHVVHPAHQAPGESVRLLSAADPAANGTTWTLHVTARLQETVGDTANGSAETLEQLRQGCSEAIESRAFYDTLAEKGLELGPSHQGIERLWIGSSQAVAQGRLPDTLRSDPACGFHPCLLDACLQVMIAAGAGRAAGEMPLYLPFSIARVHLEQRNGPMPALLWSHARLRPNSIDGPEGLTGDVRIFDETGHPVATVEGLHVRRLSGETGDWRDRLYRIDWHTQELSAPVNAVPGPDAWLVIGTRDGIASRLVQRLAVSSAAAVLVQPGAEFATELAAPVGNLGIVYVAGGADADFMSGPAPSAWRC